MTWSGARPWRRRALASGPWVVAGLIAVLSLSPRRLDLTAVGPGGWEHPLAYFALGAAAVLAGGGRSRVALLGWLWLYGIALEVLQTFVPGRTPLVSDAVSSAFGAALGVFAGRLVIRVATNVDCALHKMRLG